MMKNKLAGNSSKSTTPVKPKLHILVPAAGVGSRFGADRPKQYMPFLGTSLIDHSLIQLQGLTTLGENIEGLDLEGRLLVGLAAGDQCWSSTEASGSSNIERVAGGATRARTVSNMLAVLEASRVSSSVDSLENDWILIHDAVRPCISPQSLQPLIKLLKNTSASGLSLGRPVYEAVKRVAAGSNQPKVLSSENREGLWTTQTPQVFRFQALKSSLDICLREGLNFDDEMMALHHSGFETEMVEGSPWNIKVTRSEDLQIAQKYWQIQTDVESN